MSFYLRKYTEKSLILYQSCQKSRNVADAEPVETSVISTSSMTTQHLYFKSFSKSTTFFENPRVMTLIFFMFGINENGIKCRRCVKSPVSSNFFSVLSRTPSIPIFANFSPSYYLTTIVISWWFPRF